MNRLVVALQGRPVAQDAAELDTEELRLRRIQEKNRRNQRKFRARQRVRPKFPSPLPTHHPHHFSPQVPMACKSIEIKLKQNAALFAACIAPQN